jgi:hypothetical protein
MTECGETLFPFEAHFSRRVVAQFAGDWLTTEGGSLLLRQADRKIGLLRRVAGCFRFAASLSFRSNPPTTEAIPPPRRQPTENPRYPLGISGRD